MVKPERTFPCSSRSSALSTFILRMRQISYQDRAALAMNTRITSRHWSLSHSPPHEINLKHAKVAPPLYQPLPLHAHSVCEYTRPVYPETSRPHLENTYPGKSPACHYHSHPHIIQNSTSFDEGLLDAHPQGPLTRIGPQSLLSMGS